MATRPLALPQPAALRRYAPPAVIAGLILLAFLWPAEAAQFPEAWNLGLRGPVDEFQSWVIANRATHPIFLYFFEPLSAVIDAGLRWAEDALLGMPWVVVVAVFFLQGWLSSGLRLALLSTVGLLLMGLFGLWKPSMQTLALMAVAVALAIVLGLPLGILAAASERVDGALRPVLDAMQTMPTFVYLIPVLLFFGIARVPAVVATLVYAVPPMIRLTSLGLRQVSPPAVEAARAFGSTRWQLLFKVQLPLALPAIMTGVNQTIMMALSMVVIAALIGAGGLGREVLLALQRLQVGKALEAGIAIVLLAVILDRFSEALSRLDLTGAAPRAVSLPRWLPAAWEPAVKLTLRVLHRVDAAPAAALAALTGRDAVRRHAGLINAVLLMAGLYTLDAVVRFGSFPDAWRWSLRGPTDAAVAWLRDNAFEIQLGALTVGTGPFSDFITLSLLNPLRDLFTRALPWPVVVLGAAALGGWAGGWRLAAFTGAGTLALGWLGMWTPSMDTFSQVLATMLFTLAIAIPLGVAASQNDGVRAILRPALDFLQTIPSFVFLVPVIMLFNIGRVPGLIASVLYAIPPGVKLTDLGIRQVPGEAVEAGRAFGSTRAQLLAKVQVPMALPAILVGVNQMVMMVLAMVIIAGLVGGAGLGLEAVTGLARNQTGRGLEAGLAIVLLAVIIDRITQAWAARSR